MEPSAIEVPIADRYFDPLRPFKCEQCHESFTQKNILLVHFNSVSHLNKVKKKSECSDDNITSLKRKLIETDSEHQRKRFKCDICKVAYAQGSTLDIHMRSVLHQTKACRQESSLKSSCIVDEDNKLNSNQFYKILLENFGFDIVKQFNEFDYPRNIYDKNDVLRALSKNNAKIAQPKVDEHTDLISIAQQIEENEKYFKCPHCTLRFNSLLVLKTHIQENHKDAALIESHVDLVPAQNPKRSKSIAFYDEQNEDQAFDYTMKQIKDKNENALNKASVKDVDHKPLSIAESFYLESQCHKQDHVSDLQNTTNLMPPLELLNFMQFHHHMMGLNFMNLAPPLGNASCINLNLPSLISKISSTNCNQTSTTPNKQVKI